MAITNKNNLPLLALGWIFNDEYDYNNDPNYISATTLMQPVRAQILSKRAKEQGLVSLDASDLIASRNGTAVHDSVEKAWKSETLIKSLVRNEVVPESIAKAIRINPTKVTDDIIPIYIEKRGTIKVNGMTVGGKFDFVVDGQLQDIKRTSVYKYIKGDGSDYILQGSIYRVIHSDIIESDTVGIIFWFRDWNKGDSERQAGYPSSEIFQHDYELMSPEQTMKWMHNRIQLLKDNKDLPQEDMIECPEDELWMTEAVHKYYANPAKTGRATKNFKDRVEAQTHLQAQGKGIIITSPAVPRRCDYCSAASICNQKDKYTP